MEEEQLEKPASCFEHGLLCALAMFNFDQMLQQASMHASQEKNCLQNQHTTHLFYAQLVVEAYNMYFSTLCAIFSTLILQGTCTKIAHCCVLFQHTKCAECMVCVYVLKHTTVLK